MTASDPLLSVRDLVKHFPITRGVFGKVVGHVRAVDGVSFDIARGETLGLVGESGCGKTTAGRCILRLLEPTGGEVIFDGKDLTRLTRPELRPLRRDMQIIFQDPFSSLNPRMRIADIIGESLEVHGIARGQEVDRRVGQIMRRVGLSPSWINRYPHEFSGGQRQRVGIARAIALEPKLIVCDEAVSALDVSIQAQVINLLIELRREMNLSYLFIAHDLSVVRHISQRVAVMYLGEVVEAAPTRQLFEKPAHPYTRALLSAIPVPKPRQERKRIVLQGDVPSPANPPSGCRFHTRCPAVMDRCREEYPRAQPVAPGHTVQCFHAYDLSGADDWYAVVNERIARTTRENPASAPSKEVSATPVQPAAEEPLAAADSEGGAFPDAPRGGAVTESRAPAFIRTIGSIVCGGGLLLVAFGHYFVGPLVASIGYGVLLRNRVATPRRADALVAGALVLALGLSFVIGNLERRALAREELGRLTRQIDERAKATGTYPEALADLGWRLYPIFEDGRTVDPWGNPWHYRAPGSKGAPFDLGSFGPDERKSSDDIGRTPSN